MVGAITVAVVAVDQLTKWWAIAALGDGPVDLVGGARLRLVHNPGTAFGLASRYAPVIAIAAVVVVVAVLAATRSLRGGPALTGIGLVLGGAMGNLGDRVLREGGGFLGGAVVDFVDLGWWPVFNVADAAITVGAVLLVVGGAREPA